MPHNNNNNFHNALESLNDRTWSKKMYNAARERTRNLATRAHARGLNLTTKARARGMKFASTVYHTPSTVARAARRGYNQATRTTTAIYQAPSTVARAARRGYNVAATRARNTKEFFDDTYKIVLAWKRAKDRVKRARNTAIYAPNYLRGLVSSLTGNHARGVKNRPGYKKAEAHKAYLAGRIRAALRRGN